MKKIFTLAAAILASFSLWAADPTLPTDAIPSTAYDATVKEANLYAITDEVSGGKQYFVYDLDTIRTQMKANKVTWIKGPKNDGGNSAGTISFADGLSDADKFGFNTTWNRAWGINNGRYAGIRVTKCVEFAALTKSNSTKDGKTLYMHVFVKNADSWDFVETIGEDVYNNSKYYVSKATLDNTKEYVILLTSGNSSNCLTAQIRFASTYCEDPEFTVPEGGTGFVGDPINLAITSKNNSKPVNYAVTVDGETGVSGTDYSFNVSPGLVQATPLKAGTFVITFSQASDGTYCDAEESATFVISAKNPVTSFKVDGPSAARVGDEVTLTATDFDAAPTRVWWIDPNTGDVIKEGATYTFTASAVGTVDYYALARNNFNNADEEASDYAAGMFGSVTVTVGTDATLSDLKVNGATIDGFAADKYEYNIELGVYEAMAITATATDAPYASAAIVDNGEGKVTITVTAQNESTKEYVVNYNRADATLLAPISTSTTWDWTKAGGKTDEQKATGTMPSNAEEFNFADVLKSPDAEFNAAALAGIAQFANRDGYFQGNMVKFNTTVPGTVVVTYSNTGSKRPYRHIKVNETMSAEGSANQDQKSTEAINVSAGDVVITFYIPDSTSPQEGNNDKVGPSMGRIYKLVFTADGATAIDNTEAEVKAVKVVRDGQLLILKNGVLYNAQGAVVK